MITRRLPVLPPPTQTGKDAPGKPRPPVPRMTQKHEDLDAVDVAAAPDWRWLSKARCVEKELDPEGFARLISESGRRSEGRRPGGGTAEYTYVKTGDGGEYRLYDSFNNAVSGEKYNGAHVATFQHGGRLYYLYREGPPP
jgi:hypothetical protein